jgi:hypothetical protein
MIESLQKIKYVIEERMSVILCCVSFKKELQDSSYFKEIFKNEFRFNLIRGVFDSHKLFIV